MKNWMSDLKLQLPLNCTIQHPKYYQLIESIIKRQKLCKSTVEKRQSKSKENISEQKSLDLLISSMFVFNVNLSICSRKKFCLILIG